MNVFHKIRVICKVFHKKNPQDGIQYFSVTRAFHDTTSPLVPYREDIVDRYDMYAWLDDRIDDS